MKEYAVSDFHFGHKNILLFDDKRPFATIDEHDEVLLENYNSIVKPEDRVYFLGDFALCHPRKAKMYAEKLNGEKHWILGNHDKSGLVNAIGSNFKTIQHYLVHSLAHTKFIMFHYPIGSWYGVHRGTIHLHGHSHGSYTGTHGRMMDVGVDCTGFKPISLDKIHEDMMKIPIASKDHHTHDPENKET